MLKLSAFETSTRTSDEVLVWSPWQVQEVWYLPDLRVKFPLVATATGLALLGFATAPKGSELVECECTAVEKERKEKREREKEAEEAKEERKEERNETKQKSSKQSVILVTLVTRLVTKLATASYSV